MKSVIPFFCFHRDSFVNIGNSLVECLDCHSMYHQNCHTPPITDINLNDPRIVWYCSNCRQRDSQKVVSFINFICCFLDFLIYFTILRNGHLERKVRKALLKALLEQNQKNHPVVKLLTVNH